MSEVQGVDHKKILNFLVGCVINVASLLGVKGGKGSAAYVASKAGIIGLSIAIIKGYSIF